MPIVAEGEAVCRLVADTVVACSIVWWHLRCMFVLLVQCCVLLSTVLSIMPLVVYICGMCQSSVFLWFFLCSFLCSCLCVFFFPCKGIAISNWDVAFVSFHPCFPFPL